jgi:hypothetical protein
MDGACGTYWGGERFVQGSGGETRGKETFGELRLKIVTHDFKNEIIIIIIPLRIRGSAVVWGTALQPEDLVFDY